MWILWPMQTARLRRMLHALFITGLLLHNALGAGGSHHHQYVVVSPIAAMLDSTDPRSEPYVYMERAFRIRTLWPWYRSRSCRVKPITCSLRPKVQGRRYTVVEIWRHSGPSTVRHNYTKLSVSFPKLRDLIVSKSRPQLRALRFFAKLSVGEFGHAWPPPGTWTARISNSGHRTGSDESSISSQLFQHPLPSTQARASYCKMAWSAVSSLRKAAAVSIGPEREALAQLSAWLCGEYCTRSRARR